MNAPPPPAAGPEGWFATIVHAIRSLTFTNVIVIVILVIVLIPAWMIYRVLNDEQLLFRFLSSYREIPNPVLGSNCTLREVSIRGAGDTYGISTNFATLGNDRWQIGVTLGSKPSHQDIETYCEVLNKVIDKMRDPTLPPPTAPDDPTQPLIWPYPSNSR
jgi:hypothetical protein